jgi:hypothetical protein
MAKFRLCAIGGCGKPHYCRGWCDPHYQKWRKYGDPLGGPRYVKKGGPCAAEECKRAATIRGYCRSHYHRLKRYGDPEGGASYYLGEKAAWLREAAKLQTDNCILWPFAFANGYGVAGQDEGKGAHRVMCAIAHGPPPTPEHEAAHSCNVKACVNRRHLRWATPSENSLDRYEHGTMLLGEQVPTSKLTTAKVLAIRKMKGAYFLREVAPKFDVSIATVSRIWRRESWVWLENDFPPP